MSLADRGAATASELASRLPARVAEPFRTAVVAATAAWIEGLGDDLISVALFGSVARGEAREGSDVDLVVVLRDPPRSMADRRRPLIDLWNAVRDRLGLPWIDWSLVTKSAEEATYHSPLYLDLVVDGIVLHDPEGLLGGVLEAMRARMAELGSRRVRLEDGSWYWDLDPDYRPGEVVEI